MRRCSAACFALLLWALAGGSPALAADPIPLGPEIHVNSGQSDGRARYPDVARGADGGFVVVWDRLGYDSYAYEVFARTFDAAGSPTSANAQVSSSVDSFEGYYPFVDSDAAGKFVVVWDDVETGSYRAMARRMDATATPLGAPFDVTGTGTDLYHYNFASNVAVGDGGAFVVTWDNIDPYYGPGEENISAQRFDAAGAFVGPQIAVTASTTNEFFHPTISMDADDDFVIVWTDLTSGSLEQAPVLGQRFDAAGAAVGSQFTVTTKAIDHSYGPQRLAPVSMNASGAFVVSWIDYTTGELRAQRYDASGAALGGALVVSASTDYALDVALEDDGDFIVVWVDDYIMGRRYDTAAASFGAAFQVSGNGGFDRYDQATVATTDDDAFVVAWSGQQSITLDDDVFARRFGIPQATGITGTKLVIVDKEAVAGKAKVVFLAKNDAGIVKGPAGEPAALSGAFDVFYTDQPSSVAGSFVMPSPWRTNDAALAKYVNTLAPGGPTQVKMAVLKDGLIAKVQAKGLGDGPAIDLFSGAPSASGGVTAVLTLVNAGLERRFCTRFAVADGSEVTFSEIAGGLGRKLVARNGVPAACP